MCRNGDVCMIGGGSGGWVCIVGIATGMGVVGEVNIGFVMVL